MDQGTILRIEKTSPNDGQGLRTVVFFKGCPLHCAWCSTPESQSMHPEWFYKQAKCLHCGRCIKVCPQGALTPSSDLTAVVRDKTKCVNCFHCASLCPTHAIGIYGKTMTTEEVMTEIRKDTLFYFFSNGGVTLSGGDVLCQADFARQILIACKEDCINTTAELDMYGAYEPVYKVLEFLNSYHVDIKAMEQTLHKQWTGVDNTSILENIRRSCVDFPQKPLYVRVPLIPAINDSEENITQTVEFCKTLPNCKSLEFLPYHCLGVSTYGYTGRTYPLEDRVSMTYETAYGIIRHIDVTSLPFTVLIAGKHLPGQQRP